MNTLTLLPLFYFQTGGRGVECMKSKVFPAKGRLQPCTVGLCPALCKELAKLTTLASATSQEETPLACHSVIKELGLFLRYNTG